MMAQNFRNMYKNWEA